MYQPHRSPPGAKTALILNVIGLSASVLTLLMMDPEKVRDRLLGLINFAFGQGSSSAVALTPVFSRYSEMWPVYLTLFAFLTTITYYEFKEEIIPNAVTIPGMAVGLGMVAGFRYVSLISSISGVLVGMSALAVIGHLYMRSKGNLGFGLGVIKMQGMVGAFLGIRNSIAAFFVGALLASGYGVTQIVRGRRDMQQLIEFGPFLGLGALICTLIPLGDLYWSFLRKKWGF